MVVEKDYSVVVSRKKLYWGAITAGLLIAVMSQVLMSLLGLSLGLILVPGATETGEYGKLGLGAGVWWLITGAIALYLGGTVAGRTAGAITHREGALHGLLVWAFSGILGIVFAMSTIGNLLGGAFTVVNSGLQAAASSVGAVISKPGTNLPNFADPQIRDMANRLVTQGPDAVNREEFVNLLVERNNMQRPDAERTVDDLINAARQGRQSVQEGVERAQEAGKTASKAGAAGAFLSFLTLAVGAAVAAWGGSKAVDREVVV